ncbi:MAG TPA: PilN domain-containing protein [Steroidobacteraceae bacterium]|nr:PilN domain-containing protein [Steroidobacteraceae bacterium]
MPRINLLPWREAERKRKRQEFLVGILVAGVISLMLGLLAKFQMQSSVDYQTARNQMIKEEIAKVDKDITTILGLETQRDRLLARMDVIEQLQRSRPGIVHLFDQMVKTIPDGVYFTSIKQTGGKVQINGVAQSGTRVSALMRNIEASEWMADPSLEKVETKGTGDAGADFVLYANQSGSTVQEPTSTRKGAAQRNKRAGAGS